MQDPVALNHAADLLYDKVKDLGITKVVGIEFKRFYFWWNYFTVKRRICFDKKQENFLQKHIPKVTHLNTVLILLKCMLMQSKRGIRCCYTMILATGGTAAAAIKLIEKAGGEVVSIQFLIELTFIPGRSKLTGYNVDTLISYDDEN